MIALAVAIAAAAIVVGLVYLVRFLSWWLPMPFRGWLQDYAGLAAAIALALSVGWNAWFAVQVYGFKVGPFAVEGLQAKAAATDEARADTKLSEGLRAQEQAQDVASFTATTERCEQRVSAARDAGRAIEEITNYGRNVSTVATQSAGAANPGVAGRSIVPAGELRRVIGQAEPGQAASVPAGNAGGAAR